MRHGRIKISIGLPSDSAVASAISGAAEPLPPSNTGRDRSSGMLLYKMAERPTLPPPTWIGLPSVFCMQTHRICASFLAAYLVHRLRLLRRRVEEAFSPLIGADNDFFHGLQETAANDSGVGAPIDVDAQKAHTGMSLGAPPHPEDRGRSIDVHLTITQE